MGRVRDEDLSQFHKDSIHLGGDDPAYEQAVGLATGKQLEAGSHSSLRSGIEKTATIQTWLESIPIGVEEEW